MTDAYIPYGGYWSTPFTRWQGTLSHLHSLKYAAKVAREALEEKDIPVDTFDLGVLGYTVPQKQCFYGMPWVGAMMGADSLTGPTVMQACATSARCLQAASQEIADETAEAAVLITCDRTSNGAHIYYPAPTGMGGTGETEDWVLGNFNEDPNAKLAMVDTAENVASKWQITTEEQHAVVLRRYEQYLEATAHDSAFHKRYMKLPVDVPDARFRKTVGTLEGDEGIVATSREKIDTLKPVRPDGTVTFAGQTHPADGNTGMIVTTRDKAKELSADAAIEIRVAGFGMARTEAGYMPHAPVPASQRALDDAGLSIDDIDAVKTHNPFAVNDIVFCRETGYDPMKMNNYGCSLIWGHPQGPTGLRGMVELIEELAERGGGRGLFNGCAAGDSSMAAVIEVTQG